MFRAPVVWPGLDGEHLHPRDAKYVFYLIRDFSPCGYLVPRVVSIGASFHADPRPAKRSLTVDLPRREKDMDIVVLTDGSPGG